jgi:hypothetical protein
MFAGTAEAGWVLAGFGLALGSEVVDELAAWTLERGEAAAVVTVAELPRVRVGGGEAVCED